MFDPYLASSGVFASGFVALAVLHHRLGKSAQKIADHRDVLDRYTSFLSDQLSDERSQKVELSNRIAELETAEQKRRDHLKAISAKGKAVQIAAAAAKRELAKVDEIRARDRTLDELSKTRMRPRTRVVAPVKAKRTKAKKSGAGVAAKEGG